MDYTVHFENIKLHFPNLDLIKMDVVFSKMKYLQNISFRNALIYVITHQKIIENNPITEINPKH